MAFLNFNYGLAKDLPEVKANGSLYITTDDQRLYVDLDGQRITVSDFIEVADMAALNALGSYTSNVFYYVKTENALMKYVGGEKPWKQLNSLKEVQDALETATNRIASLETANAVTNDRIDNLTAGDIDVIQTFTVTTPVGNFKPGDEITAQSVQQLFMDMLCKDSAPEVVQPSVSTNNLITTYYEAGTTGTKEVTVTYNDGKYAHGFALTSDGSIDTVVNNEKAARVQKDETTGANSNKFTLKLNGIEVAPKNSNGITAVYDVTPVAQSSNTQQGIAWDVSYSQGNIPVSILNTKYPTSRISEGTKSGSKSDMFRWYLPMYFGFKNNNNMLDKNALTATQIKNLGGSVTEQSAYNNIAPSTATSSTAWRQFFVAIPEVNGKELKNINDSNGLPCDFEKCNNVTLTFGSTNVIYEVWCVQHAANYNTTTINLVW